MEIRKINDEVYQAEGKVVWATRENLEFLHQRAAENPRGRARLCGHPGPEDPTHEMLVVLSRKNFIRPHIHPGKTESYYVMQGRMIVVLFQPDGSVLEAVPMGDLASGRAFYSRMTVPLFHTFLPLTDYVAFQEVTQGPFRRDVISAPWAPEEGQDGKLQKYLEDLRVRVELQLGGGDGK
jgi:cupin fold WbuC family metalloprotein